MFKQGLEYLNEHRNTAIPILIATSIVLAVAIPVVANPTWRQNVWSFVVATGPTALQKAADAHHRAELARIAVELATEAGKLAVNVAEHIHVRP